MAARRISKLWDETIEKFSESFVKTVTLLNQSDVKGARKEFSDNFIPAEKKLYEKLAKTYPLRFKKMTGWCDWIFALHHITKQANAALSSGNIRKARVFLDKLRKQFFILHYKSDQRKCNDHILAFYISAHRPKPSVSNLKITRDLLRNCDLSLKAKSDPDRYHKAVKEWAEKVDPILASGQLNDEKLKTLREATDKLYFEFGIPFE